MPDREKVISLVEDAIEIVEKEAFWTIANGLRDALALLKEQEGKPLRCKECSYHRNDGWCNEHGREVKESDYCSFGAWEGR